MKKQLISLMILTGSFYALTLNAMDESAHFSQEEENTLLNDWLSVRKVNPSTFVTNDREKIYESSVKPILLKFFQDKSIGEKVKLPLAFFIHVKIGDPKIQNKQFEIKNILDNDYEKKYFLKAVSENLYYLIIVPVAKDERLEFYQKGITGTSIKGFFLPRKSYEKTPEGTTEIEYGTAETLKEEAQYYWNKFVNMLGRFSLWQAQYRNEEASEPKYKLFE